MSYLPFLSVLTVVDSAAACAQLRRSLDGLLAQRDTRWQWVVAVDPAAPASVGAQLLTMAEPHPRLHLARVAPGQSAAEAAFEYATGEQVCWLEPGDWLDPNAVGVLRDAVTRGPWVYTDEGWAAPDGWVITQWLKPGFSPELMRSQPYATSLAVLPREVCERLGGIRAVAGSAGWYDLVLRVWVELGTPFHLTGPYYLRLYDPASTRFGVSGDPQDRCRVVLEHCRAVGIAVDDVTPVAVRDRAVGQRVHRSVLPGTVSVVIPTRGSSSTVFGFPRVHVVEMLRSVWTADRRPGLQLVIVVDADTPPQVLAEIDDITGGDWVRVDFDGPFDYARKCNRGAVAASGEYLCFLNDDVQVRTPGWLDEMVSLLADPEVGAVGAKLLFADGTLQHAGLYGDVGVPSHLLYREGADALDLGAAAQLTGERSGVTGACLVMRRADFLEVGGFSEVFPLNYNDVDLCFKLLANGQRVLYTPHAVLDHYESQTRPVTVTEREVSDLQRRWQHQLDEDPYVNPLRRQYRAPAVPDFGS